MADYPRTGLLLRYETGISPEVNMVCIKFCKWLRRQFDFPIRVVIYLKPDYRIRNRTTNEMALATFLAPYDKNLEPEIRIATGSYMELIKLKGKKYALYEMLDSIAHEIIHYQQWLEDKELNEDDAEEQGYNLVDSYLETFTSILDLIK